MNTRTVGALGVGVSLGGLLWGLAWVVTPSEEANRQVEIWASGVFQLGVLALLAVMWFSFATGPSRAARGVLAAEIVALLLAIAWTVPYLFDANRPASGALVVLDAFWPLSMVGLIVVGVMVLRARQWPAPLRYLPLVASILIPVDIAVASASDDVRNAVMGAYLAASYGLLGAVILREASGLAAASRRTAPRLGPPGTRSAAPDGSAAHSYAADVWSYRSENSILSIRSRGSILSISSVGSFASAGSIGSAVSFGSLFSYQSTGSALSHQCNGSVLSSQSDGAIRNREVEGSGPAAAVTVVVLVLLAIARRRSRR